MRSPPEWFTAERSQVPADEGAAPRSIAVSPRDHPDEFMLEYLRSCDGFVTQQELVEAHELSAPTVSRRLQRLEGEGRIERYSLGREKVVCLPGQVPDAFVPFDDA